MAGIVLSLAFSILITTALKLLAAFWRKYKKNVDYIIALRTELS